MDSRESNTFEARELLAEHEKDLIEAGLISADQLAIARISQANLGLDLGAVLIKKGFISEGQLLKFLASRLHIAFVSLKDVSLIPEMVHRIPLHLARQHKVVPLSQDGDTVTVAMANPFDAFAKEDLKDILKANIVPCLASSVEIEETLSHFFEDSYVDQGAVQSIEIGSEVEVQSDLETRKAQEMALGPKVVAAVNSMIVRAHAERASDIHIEPSRGKVTIRFRIDGLLRERGSLPKTMHLPVISRIKIMAGLDIAEHRMPQDGRVRILLIGKPLDLRVSTCPTQLGEKAVLRLLFKDEIRNIESLGFSTKERRLFSEIISKSHGIFLATGPTGSGKSTTLYAALARINSSEKNIISIEDPVENEVAGVNQIAVHTKSGLTFASVLRSTLRQDPDVILIGEIRDAETAQIAVRAAITGHLVLSTLHTNTASGAIPRLVDLGVEPFLIASALKGVMAQRLVRKICTSCRVECTKIPAANTLMGKIKRSFKGRGCPECHHTGFKGRVGIFEIAAIDDTVRHLIHERASETTIDTAFRKGGVKSILEDGTEKINEGTTTVEEVLRVTQDD